MGGDEPATMARERVPDEAHAALRAVEAVLGRAPVAAFLSGSAVAGGLRPLSDVDVLVVVDDAPDEDARRRLAAALAALLAELWDDERNVLLTLARMWHTAATGAFVPKDAAAAWVTARLPAEPARWLELAGSPYVGASADDWRGHEAEVATLAERLRREVERACGSGDEGPCHR